jgi:hypothetical protein
MLKQLYTINGELTCKLSSKIEDELKDIALMSSCNFRYNTVAKTKKYKVLDFEYEGSDINIQKAKDYLEAWKLKNLEESLKLTFRKCKVRGLNEEMLNGQFKISVNVNKFSNFLNLAQTVVDELDITAQMSQNNKGFLQGKDVTVKAFGNTQELKAFKRIMESFMTI